jgi:hypothetical protein
LPVTMAVQSSWHFALHIPLIVRGSD